MQESLHCNFGAAAPPDADLPYYQQFEAWYLNESGLFMGMNSRIRWDPRERSFFCYQLLTGYYEKIYEEQVNQIFSSFADHAELELEPRHFNIFLKRFKSWELILFLGDWNQEGVENLTEGVINLETLVLEGHCPSYMFRYAVPRHYNALPDPCAIMILNNLLRTGNKPREMLQFLVNMVHRDYTQKMFLIVYGKAGGGKSTLLNIPANLYGDTLTSTTDLYHLGKKFGLADIWDKRVNIDSDIPTKTMNANVVSILKKLTGGVRGSDNKITVEKKGVDLFSVRIQVTLVFGCNQLPKWDEESLTECESIGRRALLNHYQSFQIDCPGLEEITLDPEFLDDIYSYLLQQKAGAINKIGKEAWIKQSLDEWFTDCDPLLGILKENYEYVDNEKETVGCHEVYAQVLEDLQTENSTIPKNLMAQITQSLMTLGIKKNTTKNNPKYLKIRRLYDEEFGSPKGRLC